MHLQDITNFVADYIPTQETASLAGPTIAVGIACFLAVITLGSSRLNGKIGTLILLVGLALVGTSFLKDDGGKTYAESGMLYMLRMTNR
jgi:hypothetical protein